MTKKQSLFLSFLLLLTLFCQGQIKLPKLISNGAILQRDVELKIWGWASPNEPVELQFNQITYKTVTNGQGEWHFLLPPQKAGGPHKIVLKGSNQIELQNILFGDVWVCSGQSNMELPMERVKEKYPKIITQTNNSKVRQFLVADGYDFKTEHVDFEDGEWVTATPENVLEFSAVAYFFATEIYERHQIPIGLINAALGGSPVESWMSEKALKKFPKSYQELQKFKNDELISQIQKDDKARQEKWYNELDKKDLGLNNSIKWSNNELNHANWQDIQLPGYWADTPLGQLNGSVWFRKDINVPESMLGKPVKLVLGRIVDADQAYINGQQVGNTTYQYPPRRYSAGASLLKKGKNTIAVRVINNSGRGGFVFDKSYYLAVEKDTIDLKGNWKYKLGTDMPPLASQTFIRWKPGGLYNKMIAPLFNYRIKGALWYQGESNTNNPVGYSKAFTAMIQNWRNQWNQGDFPFLYVQLANYLEESQLPVESNWARLRQEQLNTLGIPNTGMAVAIDLGEWNDVHPLNKSDLGKRLGLLARKMVYHENKIYARSPTPKKTIFKRKKVIISFNNVGNGLVSKNGENLKCFSISKNGTDFSWANAKIKGKKVIIWHHSIAGPKVVRYAWANNPVKANLFTVDGLPASPFEVKNQEKK